MNDSGNNDDKARGRFIVLQALRLGGVAMVLIALLGLNNVIAIPALAAWPILVIGLIDIFVVPQVLARKWRTPLP